jgi:hypothetical protein
MRRKNGIPLHPAVELDLQKLGETIGVRFGQ